MNNTSVLQNAQPSSRKVVTINNVEIEVILGQDLLIDIPNVHTATIFGSWILDAAPKLQVQLFTVLTDLLQTHSEYYTLCVFRACKAANASSSLFAFAPITLSAISEFVNSDTPVSYQSFVKPLLRRLQELDPELLDAEATSFLASDVKWEERNNAYFRLMTNCPEGGALTDQELHNIHGALNLSYSRGEISQSDFTLMWMFIGTGLRPIQVARMRRSDVGIHEGPEGKEVMLRVPLAKGEGLNKDYWLRRAPSVLAEALISYLDNTDGEPESPLFYGTTNRINYRFRALAKGFDTWSERLGTPIPLNPYRLRYTLATRALAQGASDWEVARLLTHRSTSCIQFYRASMPELLNPIVSAIGKEMSYFGRAFQGRLINDLSEATRKDEGEAEIMDFVHLTQGETLGACGTNALCYMNAPVSCLSCSQFEPYKEAPWEELLEKLKEDADREKDERIKLINLNGMSAIKEIIDQCDTEAANG